MKLVSNENLEIKKTKQRTKKLNALFPEKLTPEPGFDINIIFFHRFSKA